MGGVNGPNWSTFGKTMDAIRDSLEHAPRDSVKAACLARDPITGRVGIGVKMRDGGPRGLQHAVTGANETEAVEAMAGRIDYLFLQAKYPDGITIKSEVPHG